MGVWELLGEVITTQTEQEITISNLNITKDDLIYLRFNIQNASGGNRPYYITVNGLTRFDFSGQMYSASAAINTFTTGDAFIGLADNNARMVGHAYLKIGENDRVVVLSEQNRGFGGFVHIQNGNFVSRDPISTPITSIELRSNNTNAFAATCEFSVYKLKAQKVGDVVLAQEGSAVVIDNLNINKNDEYLLISQIFEGSGLDTGGGNDYFIAAGAPEESYLTTDWTTQFVFLEGTNRFRDRRVDGLFGAVGNISRGPTASSFTMSRIFINDDDRIRFQHTLVRNTLQVSPPLVYLYSALNPGLVATKIQSLTITNNGPNKAQIGANSRFELYKLY